MKPQSQWTRAEDIRAVFVVELINESAVDPGLCSCDVRVVI